METMNQIQAAALMGVTPRRMRQIDNEENPPIRDQAGQYPCKEFGEWMRSTWRQGLGFADDGSAYDYDSERARLTHHQANVAAQEDQTRQGQLIPAEVVKSTWCNLVANAKSKLLSLPHRLAVVCVDQPQERIEAEARAIVYEALNELAEGENPCLQ